MLKNYNRQRAERVVSDQTGLPVCDTIMQIACKRAAEQAPHTSIVLCAWPREGRNCVMAVRRPGTAKVDFRRVKGRKGVLRVAKEGRYAIFENKEVFMSNILDVIIFWGTTP